MNTCYNPYSLSGKTILVTGASSGIGKATAIECAKMGARVIATARNEERLKETLDLMPGENHQLIVADITCDDQMQDLISKCGAVDGLALCAGVSYMCTSKFATRKKVDWVYNTNLFAPIELTRLMLKKKLIKKDGSIVAIASISGITRCGNGNIIYGSAKSAFSTWMKFLARELGPQGIRANAICPGMVETPLIHGGTVSEAELEEDRKKYPIQRYCRPEEVAQAVVYFLSDATAWVTGTEFVIDGGKSI